MARAARRTGNLPAETSSFIGRRRELAEIRKKLAASRLVTLTGPGGVGKTRLAVRAAAAAARGFRDGVILVELAEARDGGAVAGAAVAALDLRDQAPAGPLPLLLSYLQDKELLLVLDNCEHLLDAAARLVAGVLRAAPGVRVIATSREPLLAPGEHVVPVLPLEVPPADPAGPLARLRQNESVMLFAERAAAASGGFELTEANRDAVAELCRRLDGLPLAVELAAARTRVLPAEQILGLLADRFGLLTGGSRAALPRHQALLAAIDWSHDLLRDAERTVLRRCCAFAGRFTLDDAEAVCASAEVPAAQALGVLSSLVDKSLLVRQDAQGRACYRMHETMREFAVLKLAEAGEADAVELRCARYYQAACRRPAPERRHRLGEWLQWADLEADNLRGVLRQCLNRGDTALGLDLAVSLGWFWITRAATEGMRWLGEFAAAAGEGGDPQVRAWAWFLHGFLAVLKAGPQAAGPSLEAAVAAARQAGQPGVLAEALAMASVARSLVGDSAAAGRLAGEAHAAASGLDYPPGRLAVAQARVFAGFAAGDLARVASWAAEGAGLARETGDLYGLEMMLLNQGTAALLAGQPAQAGPPLSEALRIADRIDDRVAQFYLLAASGCRAALSGRPRAAARLLGASETARAQAGASRALFLGAVLGRSRQAAEAALGAPGFAAEFDAGEELPEALARMPRLRFLEISGNPLRALPGWAGGLTGLRVLRARALACPLPEELAALQALEELDLAGLRPAPSGSPGGGPALVPFPRLVTRLPALRSLSLAGAALDSVPGDLLHAAALEELNLGSALGCVENLPDLPRLPRLRTLRISGRAGNAGRLPAPHLLGAVWDIATLEELGLDGWGGETRPGSHGSRITVRPPLVLPDDAFARMPRLRVLDLQFSRPARLPEPFYGLTGIEEVNVDLSALDRPVRQRLAALARTEPGNPARDWIRAAQVDLLLRAGRRPDAYRLAGQVLARRPGFRSLAAVAASADYRAWRKAGGR